MAAARKAHIKFEQKSIADAGRSAHLKKTKTTALPKRRSRPSMAEGADTVIKARAAEPGTVLVINVEIEQGDEGLFYATSPDLKGLFVAAATVDELDTEVPQVIKVLIEEQTGARWDVWPASKASEPEHIRHMWAAVPPHLAAAALFNEGSHEHT
jgi:hypothetical protein